VLREKKRKAKCLKPITCSNRKFYFFSSTMHFCTITSQYGDLWKAASKFFLLEPERCSGMDHLQGSLPPDMCVTWAIFLKIVSIRFCVLSISCPSSSSITAWSSSSWLIDLRCEQPYEGRVESTLHHDARWRGSTQVLLRFGHAWLHCKLSNRSIYAIIRLEKHERWMLTTRTNSLHHKAKKTRQNRL